jgi:hypothetical protein
MLRLVGLLCVSLVLPAQERWTEFRSGPFEVLTNGGEKQARDALTTLEQFRHTFGAMLSKPDLQSVWPIRVMLRRGARRTSATFVMGRDAWIAELAPGAPVPAGWLRDCGRILLDSNCGRMPAEIEEGLLALFSTLDVQGTRVTLGAPPPERTAAWTRMHRLATNPEYSGKLRVLLANLQQGMEEEPAYRNAFGKGPAEFEREPDTPGTISLSGRALDPEFSFPARPAEPVLVNARDLLEAGDFKAAAKLNPRWGEPYLRMAAAEKDARRKVPLLATACKLDQRNSACWRALAEAQFEAKLLAESARSWITAERAAANDQERAAVRKARLDADQRRTDAEAAERKRLVDEKERELQKLKNESLERIRAAEAKAAGGRPPLDPGHKVEPWWDADSGPAAKLDGTLERVDCLAGQARLVVRGADGKTTQLLIRNSSQIVIEGGGEQTLRCGPQKPPRKLSIEYTPRVDRKTQTSGDATFLRFQ